MRSIFERVAPPPGVGAANICPGDAVKNLRGPGVGAGGTAGDDTPSKKRARTTPSASLSDAKTGTVALVVAPVIPAVSTTPTAVAIPVIAQDPMASALLPELLTVVLKALTPNDLARLESTGSHYADKPGAVRRAVGERLVARLGRGHGQ